MFFLRRLVKFQTTLAMFSPSVLEITVGTLKYIVFFIVFKMKVLFYEKSKALRRQVDRIKRYVSSGSTVKREEKKQREKKFRGKQKMNERKK